MKCRLPVILTVSLILILLVAAGVVYDVLTPAATDVVRISTKKADDDFENLITLVKRDAADLAAVEVTDIKTVRALVEKYDTPTLVYTEITASVTLDITGEIPDREIRVLLLGDSEAFPNREKIVKGRVYLWRLERWADERGVFYLLSPLEKQYYRVHEGNIMVRDSVDTANYRVALPLEEFSQKFTTELRSADRAEKHKERLAAVRAAIEGYDYTDAEIDAAFVKSNVDKAKRLQNAEKLY